MAFRILADATVVLHLLFVGFVICGGLFVFRWPRMAWAHLPAAAWGAWVEFAGWICPLTPLEIWLRRRGGEAAYSSSFVEQYLLPLLYPPTMSRESQWVLGGIVILVNALVYAGVLRHSARVTRMNP